MSDISSVINLIPTANEGFSTTVSGVGVTSGGTTVPLTGVSGLTNGTVFVGIIEPGLTNEQTFTGTVDTAGVQITGVKWTRGLNVAHAAGVTVVDYTTGTAQNMIGKAFLTEHTQTGTHNAITATSLTASGTVTATNVTVSGTLTVAGSSSTGSWTSGSGSISAAVANGNRSYTLTTSADNSASISPGMRLRTTRTVAAPTQSTSLNGTTQYYSKASPSAMTFTNNFVASAWIKLSSYVSSGNGVIISRYNGTSGWGFWTDASGRLGLTGWNGGSGNYSTVVGLQSIPLNRWVHVSAQLDMATFTATPTTSYVMFDGVDVPVSLDRQGTFPTALVQAGNLEIGSWNSGTNFFPGKIAQVAIYNAKVTQANVRATMSQGLTGSETSLVSAYSFNNAITDLSANANNLTANGSAVATNADSPFGGQVGGTISSTLDYGIVQSITSTTMVVQVAEGCTIPTTGGVAAFSYSAVKTPFGFPTERDKYSLQFISQSSLTSTSGSYTNVAGQKMDLPIGKWNVRPSASYQVYAAGVGNVGFYITLSTSATVATMPELQRALLGYGQYFNTLYVVEAALNAQAVTTVYIIAKFYAGTGVVSNADGSWTTIVAENAYV